MSSPRTKFDWGELIIPGLALIYTAANLTDQIIKEVEWKTLMYSVIIGAGILITAIICIIRAVLYSKRITVTPEQQENSRKAFLKIALFLALSIGFIFVMDYLGYFISVPLFMGATCYWLNVRPWWKIAVLALAMLAIVHFLFAGWAGMPLPTGLLWTGSN